MLVFFTIFFVYQEKYRCDGPHHGLISHRKVLSVDFISSAHSLLNSKISLRKKLLVYKIIIIIIRPIWSYGNAIYWVLPKINSGIAVDCVEADNARSIWYV